MDPYNSLTDPHLYGYFSNDQRKRDLKKAGLIGKQGEVITEATYRLNAIMAEKGMRRFNAEDDRKLDENGRRLRRLPKVNMPSEDFCREKDYKHRSASCHRYFNTSKSNSYDRIKSAPDYAIKKPSYTTYQEVMAGVKNKYPWSASSPYLWPLPTPSNDLIRVNISGERQRCEGYLTYSALPAIRRSQDDHHGSRYARRDETLRLSGTLHIFPTPSANLSSTGNSNSIFQRHSGNSNNNFISSSNNSFFSSSSAKNNTGASSNNLVRKRCLVTMHYYGDPIRLSELWSYRKDEVTVEQQHCGGNTLVVFRGRLAPGSDFSFPSMRRRDFPFSLTIYIEHQQNTRISVCCEAKHRKGVRLGGNNGCFGVVDVENPGYCESCTVAKKRKKLERKVKMQKKMKGTFRKEDEDDEEESKRSQEDDDDENYDGNEKSQKRKKLKVNNRKDDGKYEDDFEKESDAEKSSGKQEETKKEAETLLKSSNYVKSNESERSKSSDKMPKKKTRTFEREDKMETEEISKSVRIKESKQESDKPKTTKSKHKKESESMDKSTRIDSSEKRSESRDKKSHKRKTPRNMDLPLVAAESQRIISANDDENESENTNNRMDSSRCDSSTSRRSNKESSHSSDKPLEAAENLENLQENENEITPREGRRSVAGESSSEIEKSGMEGTADEEARHQSRMSEETERILSSGENMEVDERNESEVENEVEDGRMEDDEKQEGAEETNEDDMENDRPSSGADRGKKREEYEVKLREAAMECVANVYRSLEKSMKEETELENPDEEA